MQRKPVEPEKFSYTEEAGILYGRLGMPPKERKTRR